MARSKPLALTDLVPHTDYPVVALCRVAQRPTFAVKVGDILARNGAWDHKYVVTEIHSVLDHEFLSRVHEVSYIEPGLLYRVTVRNLGRFYADNRFKPAGRYNDKQIDIHLGMDSGEQKSSSKLKLVQPIGELLAPTLLDERYQAISHIMNQYEKPWSYRWVFRGLKIESVTLSDKTQGLPAVPKLKSLDKPVPAGHVFVAPSEPVAPSQPPLSPEAILAHFAL